MRDSDSECIEYFNCDDGSTLAYIDTIVNKEDKSNRCLICHGVFGHKNSNIILFLTKLLSSLNMNSIRFDFSCAGDSIPKKSSDRIKDKDKDKDKDKKLRQAQEWRLGNYRNDVHEIESVINYLRLKQIEVPILIGHSRGANAVLMYAAEIKDDNLKTVIALAPRYWMATGLDRYFNVGDRERLRDKKTDLVTLALPLSSALTVYKNEFKISLSDLEERENLNMEIVKDIPEDINVVVVHGTEDKTIPVDHLDDFQKILKLNSSNDKTKRFFVKIQNGGHDFRNEEIKNEDEDLCRRELANCIKYVLSF